MIYPAPKGGWHADVVFKSTPPGIPNSMGTPVERPCATRAEAEDIAKSLLVGMLVMAAANKGVAADPVFILNNWSIKLSPDVLPLALKVMPEWANGYGSPLQAYGRVEAMLDELCPEGFDGEAMLQWPPEKQARLMATLHIAALSGLYVYPMRRDEPPKPADG